MTDDSSDSSPKAARKLNLSHAGVAGGVMAAMVMLQPVKDFFYTREEGRAVEQRVSVTELAIKELGKEFRDGQAANAELLRQAMAEQNRNMDTKFNNLETSLTRTIELVMKQQYFSKQGGK